VAQADVKKEQKKCGNLRKMVNERMWGEKGGSIGKRAVTKCRVLEGASWKLNVRKRK